jgi:tetratricopeptide (TPR) repeat protein
LHLLPRPVSVLAADRYLYVPLAGMAAAAALATTRAMRTTPSVRRALLAAAGAAAVLFGVMTTARIDDWRDELRFWLVTTRVARTDDTIPLGELANVLYRAGDYAGALPIYRAIAARGDGPDARRNLSNVAACLAMQGHYDAALVVRAQLAEADPGNARRHLDVGLVHLHSRELGQARAEFARALALAPGYDEARAMLARTDEAEAAWPAVAASGDGDPSRARWLAKLGARVEAQASYVALAARPDAPPADLLEAAQYALDRGDLEVAEILVPRAVAAAQASERAALEQLLKQREGVAERVRAAGPEIRALLERFAKGAG